MRAAATAVALLTLLLALAVPASAQPSAPGPVDQGLTLTIASTAPRVITADGPTTLTITGSLTNTGTSPVTDVGIRVQRGDPLLSAGAVREALAGANTADSVTPQFTPMADLPPGASEPVVLSVPLTGSPDSTLALARTGVYPALVNVNATRDGVRSRMAAIRTLLPVLSLPGITPATTNPPAPFTLLYPIVDPPHALPTVPGEPLRLSDDSLATSFAAGGRLNGLVGALASRAPVGSPLRTGICVAVDPALVETASRMADGYQVRRPDGTLVPGTGADAARTWLATLAQTVRGSCVTALPYADADLVALVRSGGGDLAQRAVTDGRQIAADVLGTSILADTTWPVDGVLDDATLAQIGPAAGKTGAVVLSADAVQANAAGGTVRLADQNGGVPSGILADPLLTLAAAGSPPVSSSTSAGGKPGGLGGQEAIGALAYRALAGGSGPLVLAPPHLWGIDGAGADALLDGAAKLVAARAVEPRALGATVAAGAAAQPQPLVYPVRAGAAEIPPDVVTSLVAGRDDVQRLRAASDYQPGVGAPPDQVFDPLLRGLLRGASGAWRGDPAAARTQAGFVRGRIGELVGSVRVLEPPGPFSLGTPDAPVPLTVANGLPITMTVRIELSGPGGLRVTPVPVQRVPPLGRVQVRVTTQVQRAGMFTVEAAVRTPDGGALGAPTRLQVRSTVYGTVTIWLTIGAGVLLVLLAGVRIWRRIRRDRRGGGPGPDGGSGTGPSGDPLPPTPPGPGAMPPNRRTGVPVGIPHGAPTEISSTGRDLP